MIPLNKLIIIIIFIPHFLQYLRPIRDILQLPWIHFNCPNAYLLSLKAVGNKKKCCQPDTHYLLAHFLRNEVIRNMQQGVWFSALCLVTHLFGLKVIRNKFQWAWLHTHCFVTHFMCLKMIRDLSYPSWSICKQGHIYSYHFARTRIKFYGQNANADQKRKFIIYFFYECILNYPNSAYDWVYLSINVF